ncbi:peptide deformylase [Candidatus Falkowbacteria bacterium]|jgi:peptide deformylase|nr:peptide deformylase [Candidatus Falkowbacteria bacterium]MBT7007560.1 peptide deformylase [Candidatus Falkowbacteria bacterium]
MEIILHPNDILRQKAKKIAESELKSPEFAKFVDQMAKTMLEKDGLGLAAPQVGVSKRLFIANTKQGPIALINPKIIKKSWRKETDEEGCLSIPAIYGDVSRHRSIKVKALNHEGREVVLEAKGLFARVIQHEMDHLDGVLFIDKAKKTRDMRKEQL